MCLSACTGKPDQCGHYKLPSPVGNFVELLSIIELMYLQLLLLLLLFLLFVAMMNPMAAAASSVLAVVLVIVVLAVVLASICGGVAIEGTVWLLFSSMLL